MADESLGRTEFLHYMRAFEERLGKQFARIDERFTRIDERFTGLDQRLAGMDERFARIDLRFDELTGLMRLSFEAVEALRESADRNFAEMRERHAEQMALLQSAIQDIRRRVERVEPRPRAKRSR